MDHAGFLDDLAERIGPRSRVDSVIGKTRGGEFDTGRDSRGEARAVHEGGKWVLDRSSSIDFEWRRRDSSFDVAAPSKR